MGIFEGTGREMPGPGLRADRSADRPGPIIFMKAALRVSVLRTLYLSARHRGQIIVLRGTRLQLRQGARISVVGGGRLTLGNSRVVGTPCSLHMRRDSRLTIHGNASIFRGTRIVIDEGAHLEIGRDSYINYDSTVTCFDHITIGSNCAISWGTNIFDGNAHELIVAGVPRPRTRPTHIGDNVWIGTGATVLGATVGSGAVVGAGSVVTADIPGNALATGNPARVVRENISWRP